MRNNYMNDTVETLAESRVSNKQGILRAYTYVLATDINGNKIRRRVSLGTDWCTELETARDTVERVRDNNQSLRVEAEFKINL